MVSSSTIPYYDGTKEYMEKGYVALDHNGSAGSLTLEYAYDDWTIYNTARLAGNDRVANQYKKRAANYINAVSYTHLDPTGLKKILVNLISNAFKYSDEAGEIRISATTENESLIIRVYNSGKGISLSLIHIFCIFDIVDTIFF